MGPTPVPTEPGPPTPLTLSFGTLPNGTCAVSTACQDLDCQEADDGYACSECSLWGYGLRCDSGINVGRVAMLVCTCVLSVGILGWITVTALLEGIEGCPLEEFSGEMSVATRAGPGRSRKSSRRSSAFHAMQQSQHSVTGFADRYRGHWLLAMKRLGYGFSHLRVRVLIGVSFVLALLMSGVAFGKMASGTGFSSDWAPLGGRLEYEIGMSDKWLDPTANPQEIWLIIGPENGNESAIQVKYLDILLDILQRLDQEVRVPLMLKDGTESMLGFNDFCLKLDHPTLSSVFKTTSENLPCTNPSVLDCFFEGAWQFENVSTGLQPENASVATDILRRALISVAHVPGKQEGFLKTYEKQPTYRNLTDAQLVDKVQGGCEHWNIVASLPRGWMFGSYTTADERLVSARRLGAKLQLGATQAKAKYGNSAIRLASHNAAKKAQSTFIDRVTDFLEAADKDSARYPGVSIAVYSSTSFEKMFDEIGQARTEQLVIGLVCTLVFVLITQSDVPRFARTENNWHVGLAGLVLVLCSTVATYGFLALCGIEYNHAIVQALPFLSVGLGLDDFFIIMHYYRLVPDKSRNQHDVVSDMLEQAGISITTTSLCNMACFFAATLIPVRALRHFLIGAGVAIGFNFIFLVPSMCAILSCLTSARYECYFQAEVDPPKKSTLGLQHCIEAYWVPLLKNYKSVRIGSVLLFFCLPVTFIITLSVSHPLDFGFDVTDLTPDGSYLAKGFSEMWGHLYAQRQPGYFVILGNKADLDDPGVGISFPDNQERVRQFYETVLRSKWSSHAAGDGQVNQQWLDMLLGFVDRQNETIADDVYHIRPGGQGLTLACDAPCGVPIGAYCKPSRFWDMFHRWRHPEDGGVLAIEALSTEEFGWLQGTNNFNSTNELTFTFYQFGLNMKVLTSTGQWVDHIEEFRHNLTKSFGEKSAFPLPVGNYLEIEQFVSLKNIFWKAFALCVGAILAVGLLVPLTPLGAVLVALGAAAVTVALAGILMLTEDIAFSSMLAVALLMSLGIAVEDTVHVVSNFQHGQGTREDRLVFTLVHSAAPVIEGSISSCFSFALFALSEFPYVRKYWFVPYMMLVALGLIHGILFLPSLLSFIGARDRDEEDAKQRYFSIKGLVIALALLLVLCTAFTTTGMSLTTSQDAIDSTKMANDNGINTCVDTSTQNVNDVAVELIEKTTQIIQARVKAYVRTPVILCKTLIGMIAQNHPDVSTDPAYINNTVMPQLVALSRMAQMRGIDQVVMQFLPVSPKALASGTFFTSKSGGLIGTYANDCRQQLYRDCLATARLKDLVPDCDHLIPVGPNKPEHFDFFGVSSRDYETNHIGFNETHVFTSGLTPEGKILSGKCNFPDSLQDYRPCIDEMGDCVDIVNDLVAEQPSIAGRAFLNGLTGGIVDPPNMPLWSPLNTSGMHVQAMVYASVEHPAAIPVFGKAGPRLAYLLVSLSTERVSGMIQEMQLPTASSRLYIVQQHPWTEERGILAGASHGYSALTVPPPANQKIKYLGLPLDARDSNDPVIREHAKAVFKYTNDYAELRDAHDVVPWVSEDGVLYITRCLLLSDDHRLTWFIMLLVPRDEIMATIDNATVKVRAMVKDENEKVEEDTVTGFTIMIAVVVSVAAVLVAVAVVFTLLIARPLRELEDDMIQVAGMRLDGLPDRPLSFMTEVNDMQRSFGAMISNLKEFRNYMPQSILLDESGSEEEQPSNPSDPRSSESKVPTSKGSRLSRSTLASKASKVVEELRNRVTEGVTRRQVSVIVVNVRDFHSTQKADLATLHTKFVENAMETFSRSKGVPETFLGDRMCCAFNSVRQAGTHRILVCESYFRLQHTLQSVQLEISGGAASETASFGNFGCAGMKKFTVFGTVVPFVFAIERLSRDMGTMLLTDKRIASAASGSFLMRIVDVVVLPKHSLKNSEITEFLEPVQASEDEWMYQLQEAQNNPCSAWNCWAAAVLSQDWAKAAEVSLEDCRLPSVSIVERFQAAAKEQQMQPRFLELH
eukprot:TRINITY_DN1236_c4_g1_i1.p1 TRINITY_DN1236_c4_g1~~TRINITY_DN1236_c4_g1_i1.p1  ORF type:complete len:2217 (+),score=455.34 TRINITY_DN1236_c4_g1_i1:651-6653(+)